MAQSLSKVLIHLVFSTKGRTTAIPAEIEKDVHAYLAGACRALGSEAFRVGGTPDHVHIACSLPRTLSISKLVMDIKKSSSAWLKDHDERCRNFSWQAGYGAFSLGQSQLEILKLYGIEFDERYLWD